MINKKHDAKNVAARITDLDIQALVDTQLEQSERREIMKIVMASPEMLMRLEELMLQNKLLKEWWASLKKL